MAKGSGLTKPSNYVPARPVPAPSRRINTGNGAGKLTRSKMSVNGLNKGVTSPAARGGKDGC